MSLRPEKPLDPAQVLAALNRAQQYADTDTIDSAVTSAFQVGLTSEFVGPFLRLLELPHHHRHEDIVGGLQDLKDPAAVEGLYQAAQVQHAYLAYDKFFGLARKCTWALADIGTAKAKQKLEQLASVENPLIAQYAQKRLDRWESERVRKGPGQ